MHEGLLPRPVVRARQGRHQETLPGERDVLVAPRAEVLVVRVLGPGVCGPLVFENVNILEADLFHEVLEASRILERTTKDLGGRFPEAYALHERRVIFEGAVVR